MKLTVNGFLCLVTLLCTITSFELTAQHVASQSAHIIIDNIDASIEEHLDRINLLNYQYPSQAKSQLDKIEQAAQQGLLTDAETLRLALLQCYNLLEHGEREAAVTQAHLGISNAKNKKFDHIKAYFILCEAEAHYQSVELDLALPLVDSAITLAQQHQQTQALVNGLILRADIDTQLDNYNSVMDDLRLAFDAYPQAAAQDESWYLVPKIFITASMSNLFYSTGDISQATFYLDKVIASKDTVGKLELSAYKNAAIINLSNKDEKLTVRYLARIKELVADFNSPQNLVHNHGVLAFIDLARGRLDQAEKEILISIELLLQMDNPILLVRAQRTLAKIRFKQGRDDEALQIMHKIITIAKNTEQIYDLQEFYAILSEYYAEKQNFQLAYDYLQKRFELGAKINAKLNQARFLQFKARINVQNNLSQMSPESAPSQTYLTLGQTYSLIALALVLLLTMLLFFIRKEPKLNALTKNYANQGGAIEAQLLNAKRGGYPLSLLLLNVSEIRLVDLGRLQTDLLQVLREQDSVYRHSLDEMIILLPHTSLTSAQRVAKQVNTCIHNWQEASDVAIGVASLQQLENLEQLVKKAKLDQLSKLKRRQ